MSRQDFTVFGTASEFTELVAVIKEQARREVLADLRAKVSAQWVSGYDADQVERIVGESVLALIEEAQR